MSNFIIFFEIIFHRFYYFLIKNAIIQHTSTRVDKLNTWIKQCLLYVIEFSYVHWIINVFIDKISWNLNFLEKIIYNNWSLINESLENKKEKKQTYLTNSLLL